MIEKIADAVRNKRIEGISALRDESDRNGVRVVVEVKRDAVPDVVLNQLFRFTPLQTSFGVNMLALTSGRPELMTLRDMVAAFVNFREEVITRRTRFELGKARDRAHVLVGLVIAVANIDAVIALIRGASSPAAAREALLARAWPAADVEPLIRLINEPGYEVVDGVYRLSETQARAILELRLNRLTALGRDEIGDELKLLGEKIADYLDILRHRPRVMEILRADLADMKEKFATPRRTTIENAEFGFEDEDLIQREDMVVTVSNTGYVKRVPLSTYRAQKRGGKGRAGMSTREEDFVSQLFVASTHTPLLVFSTGGLVFKIKVWRLPQGSPQARGRPLINLLPLSEGASIATIMPLPEDEESWGELNVMFATAKGNVRRNTLADFAQVKSNGKIAIRLDDDDRLIGVAPCTEDHDVLLAARGGKCIRFPVADVRVFKSRTSDGVRGMRLAEGDQVISLSILDHVEAEVDEREAYIKYRRQLAAAEESGEAAPLPENLSAERLAELAAREQFILAVTQNGFGKRSSAYEYRIAGRGGMGIANIETSLRNGAVVAAFPVEESDQIIMTTDGGQLIRCPVSGIRIAARKTQGVTLFRTAEGEQVVSVARLADVADDDGNDDDDNGEHQGAGDD